jgi:hypothetical protein
MLAHAAESVFSVKFLENAAETGGVSGTFAAAAYNLVRMRNLLARPVGAV